MKIRIKVEVIGGYFVEKRISFLLNDVTVNFYTLNENNYVEATRQVIGYQQTLSNVHESEQYIHGQEAPLLIALKRIESIGSFLFRIQKINYDERVLDWIAETDEEKAIVDRLPQIKWSLDKDNSKVEISENNIERLVSLCENRTDDIFAFEFLRQGNVSFRNDNFYFAFINYFMLLEETFGKGEFHTDQLERNFAESDVLHLCILTAINILLNNPLESLYLEWMQKEVKRRQKSWGFLGIITSIIRFRGDYLHSKERTKILEQRDHFFKNIAAFTQAVCWAYCCYLIFSLNKSDSEMKEYIEREIKRLSGYWSSNGLSSYS